MDLKEAERLARYLMDAWDLQNWTFKFDSAKRRFGQCSYSRRTISLSKHLVSLNTRAEVEDTILHEIAHAKAGGRAGHNFEWREWCRRVGAKPIRCYSDSKVTSPEPNYVGYCSNCGKIVANRYRLRKESRLMACTACCRNYNNGRWSAAFLLDWKLADGTTPKAEIPPSPIDFWREVPSIDDIGG